VTRAEQGRAKRLRRRGLTSQTSLDEAIEATRDAAVRLVDATDPARASHLRTIRDRADRLAHWAAALTTYIHAELGARERARTARKTRRAS
jgi:hypothetical protein